MSKEMDRALVQGLCEDLTLVSGEDLGKPGFVMTIRNGQVFIYDTASDTNHSVAFLTTDPAPEAAGAVARVRLMGVTYAMCKGGCDGGDRMMPSAGVDGGYVERWTTGKVTVGFAMESAAAGDTFALLIHHETGNS